MAVIKVNHSDLRSMAAKIDDYCADQTAAMRSVDQSVKAMLTDGWNGPDAQTFGGKWEGVDEAGSVSDNFRKSLENYADTLRTCAGVYQRTQEEVYNMAALLK